MLRLLIFLLSCVLLIIIFAPIDSHAQRPDAPTYGQRGPYTVGVQTFDIEDPERPLEMSIWYPAAETDTPEEIIYEYRVIEIEGQAIADAEPLITDALFPLVTFSHGNGGFLYQSTFLAEHLASYGFVVATIDHPNNTVLQNDAEEVYHTLSLRPLDVLRQIDYIETINEASLGGIVDVERVIVTGHSFGGYTALAAGGAQLNTESIRNSEWGQNADLEQIAAARDLEDVPEALWPPTTDARIQAVVAFAPALYDFFGESGMAEIEVPTLFLVGDADSLTPPATNTYPMAANVSGESTVITFENAEHYIFVDECFPLAIDFGFFASCSDPVWDMQRIHDLTNHFVTAFLLSNFYDDAAASVALMPENVDFIGVILE